MAHPVRLAERRQIAEMNLRKAARAAAAKFGLHFAEPKTVAQKYPDFYAAELIENVTAFIRQLSEAAQPSAPAPAPAPKLQRKIA